MNEATEQAERVEKALQHMETTAIVLDQLQKGRIPDPVAQRRALVQSANRLRVAADTLDQNRFLTE